MEAQIRYAKELEKIMKKTYGIIVLCLLIVLAGCSESEEEVDTGFKIYYIDQDATKLIPQNYAIKGTTPAQNVLELMDAMKVEPSNTELSLAIPKDVGFEGYNFGEAGQLQLSFDDKYYLVKGVEEVLMRAAIVKTFTQINEVKEVEFFVNGLPLMKGDTLIGRMQAEDFIDSVGEMTSYSKNATISIYFSNAEGNALVESQRQVKYDGNIALEQVIIEQLIDGPTEQEIGMKGTIPVGTILNKITKKDGICSIDFNEVFLQSVEGINADITIYSIVNTLAEQPSIDKVQFTINGETVESLKSIPLNQLFERNLNIIEGEK